MFCEKKAELLQRKLNRNVHVYYYENSCFMLFHKVPKSAHVKHQSEKLSQTFIRHESDESAIVFYRATIIENSALLIILIAPCFSAQVLKCGALSLELQKALYVTFIQTPPPELYLNAIYDFSLLFLISYLICPFLMVKIKISY